jgi:hypothetical protein
LKRIVSGRHYPSEVALRSFLTLALLSALGTAGAGDRHDWQSLAALKAGDRISVSLKSGPVDGAFENWTPDQLTAGAASAKKTDILKVQRYRQGGMGRGGHAAVGALIGFGAGFAIGAVADPSCHPNEFLCLRVSRGVTGAIVGAAGAAVGALVGVLIPRHSKELIYSVK